MARLSIRIDLPTGRRLGPGKIRLLEAIASEGSISAAGRALGMSYKRAWDLVAELNASFASALVVSQPGGRKGGGATLTEQGRAIVTHYRALEDEAAAATRFHRDAIEAAASRET